MDRRERIIELSQLILGLRNQLHILETELDALIGRQPVATGEPHTPQVQPAHAEPVAERIIRALELQRDRDFDARGMLQELGLSEDRFPTVRSTLHRLFNEGRIARPSAGRFAAIRRNQAGIIQPDNQSNEHGA